MSGLPLTVAIIGAGPLGRRLARAAVQVGCHVLLEDVMPANLHHAREALRQQLSPDALPSVRFVSTIEDAVRDADLAIDCVPDELESKLEIFCLLDRMAPPRTILATPSTRLSITDLATCTYRPERCVAIATEASQLMAESANGSVSAPLSIRVSAYTTSDTVRIVADFCKMLGFSPQIDPDTA